MSWREALFRITERIDEVGDKIFLGGALFDGAGFIFDNDLVVGNFNDFVAGDGEFGVGEILEEGAVDDELLNHETIWIESVIIDFAKM